METVDQSQELSDCGWGRPGSRDSSVWSDPSDEKALEVWGRKVPGQAGEGGQQVGTCTRETVGGGSECDEGSDPGASQARGR